MEEFKFNHEHPLFELFVQTRVEVARLAAEVLLRRVELTTSPEVRHALIMQAHDYVKDMATLADKLGEICCAKKAGGS